MLQAWAKCASVCAANVKRCVYFECKAACNLQANTKHLPHKSSDTTRDHRTHQPHCSTRLRLFCLLQRDEQPADRRDHKHAHCTNANLKPYGCHMNDDCDTCSEQNTRGHTDQKRVAGIVKQKVEDERRVRRRMRTANVKVIDLASPSSQKEGCDHMHTVQQV